MCGIAGQFGAAYEPRVRDLIRAVAHRGPDQSPELVTIGRYIGAACRLSITERGSGSQPWKSSSGATCVSFNGEIYNYQTLQKRLLAEGVIPRNASECETVVNGYERYGVDVFGMLEGMFAIALYDDSQERLYLVRDQFGIKPLYYMSLNGSVAYSSEIKSFFVAGMASTDLDDVYTAHRYVFDCGPLGRTLFADVLAVTPGTYVAVGSRGHRIEEFSFRARKGRVGSQAETIPHSVQDLVVDAVEERIPSEVDWGVFLSGGVDSSIVASCAWAASDRAVRFLTLVDDEITPDLVAARSLAERLGVSLTECRSKRSGEGLLIDYLLAREEFDLLNLWWFVLAECASAHVRVALCGQGADEVFCGYPFHADLAATLARFTRRWRSIEGAVSRAGSDVVRGTLEQLHTGDRRRKFRDFFLREQLVWFQLEPLDKCSMAHALEVRVPYLDEQLSAFMSALPTSVVYEGEKQILRDAFRPAGIPTIDRAKQFAGRSAVPGVYRGVLGLADHGDRTRSRRDVPAWMTETPIDALCLELLLTLMGECRGERPAQKNLSDFIKAVKSRL